MSQASHEISLPSIVTTTIWTSCLVIGLIGIVIPYAGPVLAKKADIPIQGELLNVELTDNPLPPLENASAPPPNLLTPPPASKPMAPPSAPALIPVAAPSPAIAFAVPMTVPTRVVADNQASYSTPAETTRSDKAPAVTQLTFGHGEGKQQRPEYPARALREGQEGLVRVVFTVGPDGRAVDAELAVRSPWPLLNEAALKVIRERWRFAPGSVRRYEVPINFKIQK